jgi:hypothetical protein
MARSGYPAEFRRRVLDLLAAGRRVGDVARDLGISDQAVSRGHPQLAACDTPGSPEYSLESRNTQPTLAWIGRKVALGSSPQRSLPRRSACSYKFNDMSEAPSRDVLTVGKLLEVRVPSLGPCDLLVKAFVGRSS